MGNLGWGIMIMLGNLAMACGGCWIASSKPIRTMFFCCGAVVMGWGLISSLVAVEMNAPTPSGHPLDLMITTFIANTGLIVAGVGGSLMVISAAMRVVPGEGSLASIAASLKSTWRRASGAESRRSRLPAPPKRSY